MERLQPRYEGAQIADLGKKIMKWMLYCFLAVMTLVGLWFALVWTNPTTIPVDVSADACIRVENTEGCQTLKVELTGSFSHYRLGNEADVFDGFLKFDGKAVPVKAEYVPGEDYARVRLTGDTPIQLLLSRDQKWLVMEYALGKDGNFTMLNGGQLHLLLMPAQDAAQAQAVSEKLGQLLTENPQWQEGFHWKLG